MASSAEAKALRIWSPDTQTVKTEARKYRLSGFEGRKFIEQDKKVGYIQYVLARYETKELNKEKARMESLLKEKADVVAIPEQKGMAPQLMRGSW